MAKIGPGQGREPYYELDVQEHVPTLDPADYGATGPVFDPKKYFITSGDAIFKVRFMISELEALHASIDGDGPWRRAVGGALRGAHSLLEYLVAARGTQIFLETEHVDHKLWVIPKDPRKREAS